MKNSDDNLISLGFTDNNSYTYTPTGDSTNYSFVVKSAYSVYKNNMSSGLTIDAQVIYDTNIGDTGGPTDTENNPSTDDTDVSGEIDTSIENTEEDTQ